MYIEILEGGGGGGGGGEGAHLQIGNTLYKLCYYAFLTQPVVQLQLSHRTSSTMSFSPWPLPVAGQPSSLSSAAASQADDQARRGRGNQ